MLMNSLAVSFEGVQGTAGPGAGATAGGANTWGATGAYAGGGAHPALAAGLYPQAELGQAAAGKVDSGYAFEKLFLKMFIKKFNLHLMMRQPTVLFLPS